MSNIPTKTSFQTTAFGVRARELVILCAAGFLGLALLALPLGSIFIRILLAAGLSGAGILAAFWRVERTWTIEAYLFNRWKYSLRPRRFVKGGSQFGGAAMPWEVSSPAVPETVREEDGKASREKDAPAAQAQPLFWLPERLVPHSNGELAGFVLSSFAVTVFLGWVTASGGVGLIQSQLQLLASALWMH
jgi:hypothetical protein